MQRTWFKKGTDLIKEMENTDVASDEVAIWYLGQCGFAIKGSRIIFIDTVLNDLCDEEGKTLRCYDYPFTAEEACVDVVLCTHEHIDHMAKNTLIGIHNSSVHTRFIVPARCKEQMIQWSLASERIIDMNESEIVEIEGVKIRAISTAHPIHKRDSNGMPWSLAYDIEMNGIHLFHMGDTYVTDELLNALKKIEAPNVLMLPINGGDYFRTRSGIVGNMSAQEAAILSVKIAADLTIPMHYDMIKGNTCNPFHFVETLWKIDNSKKIALPVLGEKIIYKK